MVHKTHLVLRRVIPLRAVRLAAGQDQLLPVPARGFVADQDLDQECPLSLPPLSWFFLGGRVLVLFVFPSEGGGF